MLILQRAAWMLACTTLASRGASHALTHVPDVLPHVISDTLRCISLHDLLKDSHDLQTNGTVCCLHKKTSKVIPACVVCLGSLQQAADRLRA